MYHTTYMVHMPRRVHVKSGMQSVGSVEYLCAQRVFSSSSTSALGVHGSNVDCIYPFLWFGLYLVLGVILHRHL